VSDPITKVHAAVEAHEEALKLALSYGFSSVLQAVTTAGQYIQGKKPDVAPSASLGPSFFPPKTYLISITFDDGTFRGRATSTSDFNAYQLVLQDARMGNVSGPQYHGKVIEWKAQDVTG